MEYTIEWCEVKTTSTGKKKMDATLKNAMGGEEKNVAIWEDFPDFANLAPGRKVIGDIVVKQNGQYLNKSLYPPKTPSAPRGGGFGGGAAAQKQKQESIEKAQDRKEESIILSSSMRMATDIVVAFYPEAALYTEVVREDFLKDKLITWRKYFVENWDAPIDPMRRQPF